MGLALSVCVFVGECVSLYEEECVCGRECLSVSFFLFTPHATVKFSGERCGHLFVCVRCFRCVLRIGAETYVCKIWLRINHYLRVKRKPWYADIAMRAFFIKILQPTMNVNTQDKQHTSHTPAKFSHLNLLKCS